MELTERITGRVDELTGEVDVLRKQLADAEHELDRLVIAEQVITQLMTDEDEQAAGKTASATPVQRGFGLLVPPRSQASGPGDLPDDYRSLVEGSGGPPSPVLPRAMRSLWNWLTAARESCG